MAAETSQGNSTLRDVTVPGAPIVPKSPIPELSTTSILDYREVIGTLGSRLLNIVLVLIALVVIVIVLDKVLSRGPEEISATDIVAVLGPVISVVGAVAAAGFGIATGVTAGAAAGAAAGNTAARAAQGGAMAAVEATQHNGQQIVNQKQRQLNEADLLVARMSPILEQIKAQQAQLDHLANLQGERGFTALVRLPGDLGGRVRMADLQGLLDADPREGHDLEIQGVRKVDLAPVDAGTLNTSYAELLKIQSQLAAVTRM